MSHPANIDPHDPSGRRPAEAYLDPTVSLENTYLFPEVVCHVDPDGGESSLTLRYRQRGDAFMVGAPYSRYDHQMTPAETLPSMPDIPTVDAGKISPHAGLVDAFIIRTNRASYSCSGVDGMFIRQWHEGGKLYGKEFEALNSIGLGISGHIGDEITLPGADGPETIEMVELTASLRHGVQPDVIMRRKSPFVTLERVHAAALERLEDRERALGGGAISGS